MAPRTNSSGLRRDVEILDLLAQQAGRPGQELGVLRIADKLQRDKSQVSRALTTLAEAGLVERDPDTLAYRIGWKMFSLAALTLESRLCVIARPYLRRIASHVDETTVLCVLRGNDLLTIASESSSKPVRAVQWEGVAVAAAATSAGRVLVCEWPEEAVTSFFTPERLESAGANPRLRTPGALLKELATIRTRGFAIVEEEFEDDVVGCSAPVRGHDGRIVAAINITAPKGRFGKRLELAARYTASVASEMSAELSGGPSRVDRT